MNPQSNFALYNLGQIYRKRGRMDKAVALMEDAIKINPAAKAAHYALGNIYMEEKQYPQAVKHYRIGLKLDYGKNVEALKTLGTALTYSGRIDEAIRAYKKALALSPRDANAINNLGALYRYKGDEKKARLYFQKAGETGGGAGAKP